MADEKTNEIEITPAMIEAGASVLARYDRLEMSETYARILAEEIITKAFSALPVAVES